MIKKILATLLIFIFLASTASAATLIVPTQYKTIQKAVDSASTGDTIYVNTGTYKENVLITGKDLTFQGQKIKNTYKYPSVYGFKFRWNGDKTGSGDINGFTIMKSGVSYGVIGGNIVRNDIFKNCGVNFGGFSCSNNTVMNNKFTGSGYTGISMEETFDNTITGNTFTSAKIGLNIGECVSCLSCTKNTFSKCTTGVQVIGVIPSWLIGNSYKGNIKSLNIIEE